MPPPVPWMPPPGVVQPGLQNLRPDGQGNGYLVAHTTRVAAVMMPVMAVVGMSSEAGLGEDRAAAAIGLTKEDIAWWLADDRHLADVDELAAQDPPWSCSICSEGVEAEAIHGWPVRICGSDETDGTSSSSTSSDQAASSTAETRPKRPLDGHFYHEGCLGQWLLKKNSCPVCRRCPIVPSPLAAASDNRQASASMRQSRRR